MTLTSAFNLLHGPKRYSADPKRRFVWMTPDSLDANRYTWPKKRIVKELPVEVYF
ncbi:hypothetical protein [Peribacillus kribbensis]|uniref:hypothetical protein n=1 Tax=Peribacillus kribbensis TaxID=356658 RepID=UPI0012DCE918|nr:hypothetical protein [Peribacillus kribbensis]